MSKVVTLSVKAEVKTLHPTLALSERHTHHQNEYKITLETSALDSLPHIALVAFICCLSFPFTHRLSDSGDVSRGQGNCRQFIVLCKGSIKCSQSKMNY